MTDQSMKPDKTDRVRATLYRVAFQHQDHLLAVADYKANMIISISTMIISAIIAIIGYGVVTGKGESYVPLFIIPVVLVILSCLISLILSIQAARPKLILPGRIPVQTQKSSLLFFGVIAGFSQQEYLDRMKVMLNSNEDMYEHMTIDMYNQGIILKRKFHLLKYAYLVLQIGFILSVAAFLVSVATY